MNNSTNLFEEFAKAKEEIYAEKLVLRANHLIEKDIILSLKGTKALKLEDMSNTDKEYDNRKSWGELLSPAHKRQMIGVDVTTWSSLVRNAVEILNPQIQFICSVFPDLDEFKATFEYNVNKICEETGINLNSNCPKRLYKLSEEDDLIKSSVYMNNKNHAIKIVADEKGIDWYMCAVYTVEIIVMLEALLNTVYSMATEYTQYRDNKDEYPHHTFVLTYINREDIEEPSIKYKSPDGVIKTVQEIDNKITRLEMSKDIMKLERKFITLAANMIREIGDDINNIQKKYNLTTEDDFNK